MLKQRVITALIMVAALALAVVYLPVKALAVAFAVVLLLAAWEWSNLSGFSNLFLRFAYITLCGALIWLSQDYCRLFTTDIAESRLRNLMLLACLWWGVAIVFIMRYPRTVNAWGYANVRALMGLLVLVPTWLAMVYLRQQSQGITLIFVVFALVISADTGAYFSGKRWGNKKMIPQVSPGKSWAGLWGGMFTAMLVALGVWVFDFRGILPLAVFLVIAMLVSVASVFGDLFESMVKRHRGIKDSGNILPGHGGIMDRVDSLTAAAPVFAAGLMLAGY